MADVPEDKKPSNAQMLHLKEKLDLADAINSEEDVPDLEVH